ncbi:hypothetical protein [Massilia sp. 9096]|uniref:hypothetical protein n=1 Tax=Massilia sp. 9096 TaxID=1500894 RepID=UPI000569F474|nr:hypothetical protein [Massilia sp. 9096]
MNVIKHMEAAFLVTLGLAGAASVMVDGIPSAQARVTAPAASAAMAAPAVAAPSAIPVVHVSTKRMSTIEKLRSLAEDMRGSRA